VDWNGCIKLIQRYLENSPLIVLGSGASMPYGLPSMQTLAEEIKKNDNIKSDPEYKNFCASIDSVGLEKAVDSVTLLKDTLNQIRTITWETINSCDLKYFDSNFPKPPETFAKLIQKVISPTPNEAVVVTTNYDRLPEYAADSIGATTVTGFEGSLIRTLEPATQNILTKRNKTRERVVNIWKVHGSLDWYVNSSGDIVSVPLLRNIPKYFQPLVVPPGKEKYSSTHGEPYRTIITKADNAFVQAESYICIGYGFNDEHIQPKLLDQIAKGKPIVILAREMTDSCKHHIIEAKISKYLIFEREDEMHTKVYGNGWTEIYDGQYWSLDEFLKIW